MRHGNFTSSEIVALTTNPTAKAIANGEVFGKPALTYIKKKIWERNLDRSIETDTTSRTTSWGKLCEIFFFQHMGILEYTPMMDEPIRHETIDYWLGSPDAINNRLDTCVELKSPQTLTSFCELVEPILKGLQGIEAINYIRDNHTDGEKYYWQIVSNCILTKKQFGELIVFCPYESQLDDIRMLAQQMPTQDLHKYYWIGNASNDELPYLKDGGYYQNINRIVFEVPESDIDFLTKRVLLAGEKLTAIHGQTNY